MEQTQIPHVLIFPFPAQGHINSMLKLAELLALSGLHVTFLSTEYNYKLLLQHANLKTRFGSIPGFRIQTISDGLPDGHPRSMNSMGGIVDSIQTFVRPQFRDMMISRRLDTASSPVSCIIADGIMTFTIDVAEEIGVPSISFRTCSACYYWVNLCLPKIIEADELPFSDDDMDKSIKAVPAMESFLRRRDLPSFFRAKELNDPSLQLVLTESVNSTRASAQIINTFEDLEGSILSELRSQLPKIYTLGPLHALLNSKRNNASQASTSSNSLLKIDRNCMTWLDSQPSKSVIYVSFGSVLSITHNQMLEFWHGLVNSGKRFLWVIRPNSVTGNEGAGPIPSELQEATKDRGCMVDWSPQEEVLVHPAVGGFLTHSGWNSTLEAVVAGLPMICWPQFADQPTNSRYVGEIWKIGVDMKDTCDKMTIERMVRDVMDNKRDELMISVNQLAEKAKESVSEGGSSYRDLALLIEDLKSRNLVTPKSI